MRYKILVFPDVDGSPQGRVKVEELFSSYKLALARYYEFQNQEGFAGHVAIRRRHRGKRWYTVRAFSMG